MFVKATDERPCEPCVAVNACPSCVWCRVSLLLRSRQAAHAQGPIPRVCVLPPAPHWSGRGQSQAWCHLYRLHTLN